MRRALFVAVLLLASCTPAEDPRRAEPTVSPERAPKTHRRLTSGVIYKRFCSRHDPPPSDLIASFHGEGDVVIRAGNDDVATIPGRPPVRWSASGALLAVGRHGALWTWDGKRYENSDVPLRLTSNRLATWAWSPNGDCALTLDDGRLGAFHTGAGANSTTLIEKGVQAAAWGPRGRVAIVLEDDGHPALWIANLKRSTMRLAASFGPETCCVVLGGWTRAREVLYWAGPGQSAMQDGWPLQSVDEQGGATRWGRTLPLPSATAPCADGVVAFTGGDRHLQGSRASLLRPGHRPKHLTKPALVHGLACSPDGTSVVVASDAGLDVVPLDGSGSRKLTRHPRLTDFYAEWGPPGVLLVRQTGLVRQLSFVTEGSRPRFAATLVTPPEVHPLLAFDWTATPPTGLLPPP